MKENSVKEYISESFIRLLMAKNRFKIWSSDFGDDGVDLKIGSLLKFVEEDGSTSYLDDEKTLKIQLKCTTEKNIRSAKSGKGLSYQLRVKNYKDLIKAKEHYKYSKLVLIVFILPEKENEWMDILDDKITLSKYAYWYVPGEDDTLKKVEFKDDSDSIRIELLHENKLVLDFESIFKKFYPDYESVISIL